MKSHPLIFVLTILLALLCSPVFSMSADGVTSTTLPNGMKVIVREGRTINLAAVDIWVDAGSVNETAENSGASHFVEHMIFKSSEKYGPGQIDREIEGLGATLNGGTSRDWVHFYTTVASEYLPGALDVLADAMVNPLFLPDDIDKERQVILDEIARAESSPIQHALGTFFQTAFSTHPYRLSPMGDRDSISRLTREDLLDYYNRYYIPENVTVAIAGDVDASEAILLVERAFNEFKRPTRQSSPTSVPVEPPVTSPRERRFNASVDQAYVTVGYHTVSASQFRELCALDVILVLLGDTHRGRVSAALNAHGIDFSLVGGSFVAQRYPTVLSVLVAVYPEDADRVLPILLAEFNRLAIEPVKQGELDHARRLVEGGDLFEQETFSGQARALGLYESIASYDLALKYGPMVRSITAQDILSVAKKYFGGNNYCVAIVEPST